MLPTSFATEICSRGVDRYKRKEKKNEGYMFREKTCYYLKVIGLRLLEFWGDSLKLLKLIKVW